MEKIGERGRAKFMIVKNNNYYTFYVRSPFFNNAWNVRAPIWKNGNSPGEFNIFNGPSNGRYYFSKYISTKGIYNFHVYYTNYSDNLIYVDEIRFEV